MIDWHVGMKVVCIKEFEHSGPLHQAAVPNLPVKGGVYTIRAVVSTIFGVGLRLQEIRNPPRQFLDGYGEACFIAENFRPLVDTEHDISLFRKLVEPSELAKFKEPGRMPERVAA